MEGREEMRKWEINEIGSRAGPAPGKSGPGKCALRASLIKKPPGNWRLVAIGLASEKEG